MGGREFLAERRDLFIGDSTRNDVLENLKSGAMLNAKPCEVMLPEETLTPTAPIFFLLSDTQTPVSFTILPLAVMP